jgi:CRP-like cAMP-binding protein
MKPGMDGAALRDIAIFAGVSDTGLERIAEAGVELDAAPGQVLALADDPGSGMFVVIEGTVTVELPGATRELGPGDFFGELALLVPDGRRIARVRASEPVRLLSISRADAVALLESEPTLTLAVLRELARRLAGMAGR